MNNIFWLTGQPGSGKTTIGRILQNHLKNSIIVDGDDIREIFNNKDYSEQGRRSNIQKAQDIALFLSKKEIDVIVALVSPYRDQREEFKKNNNVIEIYLHTTEDRGKDKYHVSNYEPPLENFIDIDTTNKNIDSTITEIIEKFSVYNKK